MARKHKHEEHTNHEAWAIPYGDLITLLLALFVCMYAISSVNEGKYRVLADSLSQAFGGPPKSIKPVQFGEHPEKGAVEDSMMNASKLSGFETEQRQIGAERAGQADSGDAAAAKAAEAQAAEALKRMSDEVERAMSDLITQQLVTVRRSETWLEIEIRTDILFASGSARIGDDARPVLVRLAEILKPFPNPVRIEGHTDNVPIATAAFPSNWELSAGRAASVVALFTNTGVDPTRLSVAGLGEYRPVADNRDEAGRNHNRRVVVVVGAEQMLSRHPATVDPDETPGALHGTAPSAAATPAAPVASAPEAAPVPALAEGELRLETAAATERPRPRADGQGLTVILPSGTLTRLQEAPPAATPAPGTRSQP